MRKKILVSLFFLWIILSCSADSGNGSRYGEWNDGLNLSLISGQGNMGLYDIPNRNHPDHNNSSPDFVDESINYSEFGPNIDLIRQENVAIDSSPDLNVFSNQNIPNISFYNPNNGQNYDVLQNVDIYGSHFEPGIRANLTNGTFRLQNATNTHFTSSDSISTSFNLQGMNPGRYWIEVKNPDGIESYKNFNLTWGSENPLYFPTSVCVDSTGNVYVTDTENNRIQKFSSTGEYLMGWGSYGSGIGQFGYPSGISVDNDDNVYVTDTNNNRVQKFSSDGEYLTSWGSSGSETGKFHYPYGICVDNSGYVFVSDTFNNRIQKFSSDGVYLTSWGSSGPGTGQFALPVGISVDSFGEVYVVDWGHNRIQKFSSDGVYLTSWGSSGSGNGQFYYPFGISTDISGNVYVVDSENSRIQKFNSDGVFLTKWGSEGSGPVQFEYPYGVCTDSSGDIYVADSENYRIQKFSSVGVFLMSFGYPGPYNFDYPHGISSDYSGNVYVADTENDRIQKYDSDGYYLTSWGSYGSSPGQFDGPGAISVDSSGNVYVADLWNDRIQKFSSSGVNLSSWGSSGTTPGKFDYPSGIGIDSSGNVYVADAGNDRIQKFTSSGQFLGTWGSSGSGPGQFDGPYSICIDYSDTVYVTDSSNDRIQKFSSGGVFLTEWGSLGSGPGQFDYPRGISNDNYGNVYVADAGNDRIQKFSSEGEYLTEWGSYGPDPGQFNYPMGICADIFGNVFVADTDNNRIQKFSDVPFTVLPAASPVVGEIVPNSGFAGSITSFNLTGSQFGNGAQVNLTKSGQTNISTTCSLSGTNLTGTFVLPSDVITSPWNVSVNQGGMYSNDNVLFTILAPIPKITNLNPPGSLQYNYTSSFPVLITGTGFGTVPSTNGVTVDGSPVLYTINSNTEINATFPDSIDNTLGTHPVIVNGESGPSQVYNFIVAADWFTINATSDGIGWIGPSGLFPVLPGSSQTFTFASTAGAVIKNITLNGEEVLPKPESTYTISNINQNYEVRLNNEPIPGIVIAAFTAASAGGNSVRFTDASWGKPTSWKWDFGDGTTGSGNTIVHSYENPGTYTVSFWTRNALSQSQEIRGDIMVPLVGLGAKTLIFGPQ